MEPTVEEAIEMLVRDRASFRLVSPPPPYIPETTVRRAIELLAHDRNTWGRS